MSTRHYRLSRFIAAGILAYESVRCEERHGREGHPEAQYNQKTELTGARARSAFPDRYPDTD